MNSFFYDLDEKDLDGIISKVHEVVVLHSDFGCITHVTDGENQPYTVNHAEFGISITPPGNIHIFKFADDGFKELTVNVLQSLHLPAETYKKMEEICNRVVI